MEPKLYSIFSKIQENKGQAPMKINKIIVDRTYASTLRSKPIARDYVVYGASSSLYDYLRQEKLFPANSVVENYSCWSYLKDYDEKPLPDGGFNGAKCPDPSITRFEVEENHTFPDFDAKVLSMVGVQRQYYGWPTSSSCYFEFNVIGSKLSIGDKDIDVCNALTSNSSGFFIIFGASKLAGDQQAILYSCSTRRSGYDPENLETDRNILKYTKDNWVTSKELEDPVGQSSVTSYKFPVVEKYTAQQLSGSDKNYYKKLLSTENFFYRQYSPKGSSSWSNFYNFRSIEKEGDYTVIVLQNNNRLCIESTSLSNSVNSNCGRRLYFDKNGRFDVVKTVEAIPDLPQELKDMRTKGWNQPLAEKIIREIYKLSN